MLALCVDIDLQNPNEFEDLPALSDIQKWCEASVQKHVYDRAFENRISILIRVVDELESASLNKKYREKEGPTNVLSFPNDVPEFMLEIAELKEQNSHVGDLVICEALVRKESKAQAKSKRAHWAHLIVHGSLHLQGLDHIDEAEAVQMEALESQILEQFGFANPYTHLS